MAKRVLKKDLLKFVDTIAWMTRDGEKDEDGETFVMENDDAYDTLNRLISDARDLLGVDPVNTNKCDHCKEMVDEIVGCPNGQEVCRDCFDNGIGQ